MIQSYLGKWSSALFRGRCPRGFPPELVSIAARKLAFLDGAASLADLRVPPGNRLERLRGNRDGQHSIRINEQWRICFVWDGGNAWRVEVCDYH